MERFGQTATNKASQGDFKTMKVGLELIAAIERGRVDSPGS
jgi:hypothetical protein